ncbi:MAG TPA: hypothetical protein VHC45_06340 [Gaiellaceae bacterium]|nr:hypothetical protein [Gaiellaceae bacterium]
MIGRLQRCRRHAAFALLAIFAEVAGRSLTARVDGLFHVTPMARTTADYYPVLLVAVKILGALALAWALARLVRAWGAADAGNRLLVAVGHRPERRRPRLRPSLSPRVWLLSFATTSLAYLVQTDGEGIADGRWPVLAPWLHTYALPVFAVLSVLVALAWSVLHWVRAVEEYAVRTLDRVREILGAACERTARWLLPVDDHGPRRRFGLAFESRPPPLTA